MMSLIDFMNARLNEREQIAMSATHGRDGRWIADGCMVDVTDHRPDDDVFARTVVFDEGSPSADEADHIAANDPATVLSEVNAIREIVHMLEIQTQTGPSIGADLEGLTFDERTLDWVVRTLAATHSDHADYNGAWRL